MAELSPGINYKKMKKLLIANGLVLMLLALFACGSSNSQSQNSTEAFYEKLDAPAFKEQLNNAGEKPLLVDVRTKGEFDQGVISEAVNYDFMNGDFEKQSENWDKDSPIYLYCAKGGRSSKAASLLQQKGFTKIYELRGGYSSWAE